MKQGSDKKQASPKEGEAKGNGSAAPTSPPHPHRPPTWSTYSVGKFTGAAVGISYILTRLAYKQSEVDMTVQEMSKEFLLKGHVERIYIVDRSYCRVILRSDAPTPDAGNILIVQ